MKNYLVKNYRDGFDFFDDAFSNFFKPVYIDEKFGKMSTDIKENDDGYSMEIEMPGFEKGDIDLHLDCGYLTISAKKNVSEEDEKKTKFIRRERSYQCQRSYFVGENVSEDDIKAKYDNGILQINIPKEQPKQIEPKKIAIE